MNENERYTIEIEADVKPFQNALQGLTDQSKAFGTAITSSLQRSIASGKSFEQTLKSIALSLATSAFKAGMKPLENLIGGFFQSAFSGLSGAMPFANGGAFNQQGIIPFANGGVVSSPTLFSAGQKLGVMGEAGSEAIMPLARGSDGKLGVRSSEQTSRPTQIVFNISTPDVDGFYRSEAQISAMLARSVGRGRRSL